MYYEGGFANNKPKGDGKWVFKNGNVLDGTYEQKEIPVPDDYEPAEGEVPKPTISLDWHSHTNISESAHKVNSVEQ